MKATATAEAEALEWHIIPFPILSHSFGPKESDLPTADSKGVFPMVLVK
jgi:hypothetical protein